LLLRPEIDYQHGLMSITGDVGAQDPQVAEQVEIQAKYAGYIERQQEEIERVRRFEDTRLSDAMDYTAVDGLSNEVRQKLMQAKPETLAHAARVPGVTPAAISLLLIHLKKRGWLERRSA
jgi:tRNA uridine 5-carboxymethylaminomethyl modification enzyme